MKRALLLLTLFLLYSVVNYGQPSTKPKTSTFLLYQEGNKFKGITFGSNVLRIQTKMNLEYLDDFMSIRYRIKNAEYLVFNGYKFDEGEACFTRDGELYQVVLHIDHDADGLSRYQQLRKTFLEIFGGNDHERADLPTRFLEWEGRNICLSLGFSPDEDNKTCRKGRVYISVINIRLNNKSNDELFKRDKVPNM